MLGLTSPSSRRARAPDRGDGSSLGRRRYCERGTGGVKTAVSDADTFLGVRTGAKAQRPIDVRCAYRSGPAPRYAYAMRNSPPPEDPDISRLLSSPAEVGGKRVWVGDMAVRRYRDRQHRPEPAWLVKLRLRQLLETGRYRQSRPAWVPAELPASDGYVELKDFSELVGLTRDRENERAFHAATWYPRDCLDWSVALDHEARRPGAARVELSSHCVVQYADRVRRHSARVARDGDLDEARLELEDIVRCGRVLPEVPVWFEDRNQGGVPAYWLVVDDWLLLPLNPSTRPHRDMYTAITCMYRDMPADVVGLADYKLKLSRESVRLHRDEMLRRAAARRVA